MIMNERITKSRRQLRGLDAIGHVVLDGDLLYIVKYFFAPRDRSDSHRRH